MDYWPTLPPVRELPLDYRAWAWWLRHGPKRPGGTAGGSALFRLLCRTRRVIRASADPYVTLHAPPRPALTIHLYDLESFHHAFPVWYRGDAETTLVQRLTEPGGTYIDAGASYGVYALYAAQRANGKVCAIEPQPHLANAIRRAAKANALTNVIVVEAALAEQTGSIDLLVSPNGSGSASIEDRDGRALSQRVRVRAMTLDEIVEEQRLASVSLLKLDVENAEAPALRGASSLLRRDAPFVIFEAGARQTQTEVFAILRAAGYDNFYDQSSAGAGALLAPRMDRELTNIIAVPRARDAARILSDR